MASPTVSARTETQLANGTSHTIAFVQTTGELVVIFLALNDTAQTLATVGDGFTDRTAISATFHILSKVLDGSEGGNVVVTVASNTKGAAIAYNIAGHDSATAPVFSTVATGTSVNPDPATLSPAGGSKDYLWLAAFRQNGEEADDDTWCSAAPTNYGNLVQKTSAVAGIPSTNGSLACADRALTAATEDPGTFTTAQSLAWRAYTVAVYPPAAATNAPAGHASGSGAANQPSAKIDVSAGHAAGTGAAQQPTANVQPGAGHAAGTGTAYQPSADIKAYAGHAAGTGEAFQPTVDTGAVNAPAGLAAGTGEAFQPGISIFAYAGHAAGTGAAFAVAALVAPSAGHAAGTGIAAAPSASIAPGAGHAAGSGVANQPTALIGQDIFAYAGHAAGIGQAFAAAVKIAASAGLASGAGTAYAPTIFIINRPAEGSLGRLRLIQYHAVIFSPDGSGGPGAAKLELDADMLNLVWQQSLNLPGQALFALRAFTPKLSQLEYMVDHIKIYREDPRGVATVFAGKVVSPLRGKGDSIILCWDYSAFLQLSVTGHRVLYPEKLLGSEVISPEWTLAKNISNSPFTFVTTGTIQDPLALDGVTPIKTNKEFGLLDLNRLFVFFMVAEMAMANTANSVVFEITRSTPHTFNFWKNLGANVTDYAFTYPGNLVDFNLDPGYKNYRNELLTVIRDATSGAVSQQSFATADVATSTYRRLQVALTPRTLVGISGPTQGQQQTEWAQRQLTELTRLPKVITLRPRQGEFSPFLANGNLGNNVRVTLQKDDRSGDALDAYLKLISVAAAWSPEAGELLQLFARATP